MEPATSSCNAVTRIGSKTLICEVALGHRGDHRDGEVTWGQRAFDESARIY